MQGDRLRWFRDSLWCSRTWCWSLFAAGALLCTVGTFVAASLRQNAIERAARQERVTGQRVAPDGVITGWGTFAVGLAMLGLAEIAGVSVAIRETHLEQVTRVP